MSSSELYRVSYGAQNSQNLLEVSEVETFRPILYVDLCAQKVVVIGVPFLLEF